MRALLTAAALLAAPAPAQHTGHEMPTSEIPVESGGPPDQHGDHDMSAMEAAPGSHAGHRSAGALPRMREDAPPPAAFEGPRHAADLFWDRAAMRESRTQLAEEHGGGRFAKVMLERLEYRAGGGNDAYLWDAQGWHGGDTDRIWLKSEGEGEVGGALEHAEVQALWSRAIGPFFDLQLGARYDFEPRSRAYVAAGVQGLAPYMFEVDAAAFLSHKGDATARIEAEYDQRITQRLILQPRAELELSAQDVPELGIGAGLSSIEAGLRLRYEIAREFAPYVGVGWKRQIGSTADFARADGENADRLHLLLGVRAWF